LTPIEAAHALGIPAGTARSRLHRARRTVQGDLTALATVTATAPEEDHA
jgi:RNA polymerase sigma-70 factor (ECF subfamily)